MRQVYDSRFADQLMQDPRFGGPLELAVPMPAMPKEVEEALAHASPETMAVVKGAIWRTRALQTLKDPAVLATTYMGTALVNQVNQVPLQPGESVAGAFAMRAVQREPGCGNVERSIAVEGWMTIRRFFSG
jgi:hypothetical protein